MKRLWHWWQERRICAKLALEWDVRPEFIASLRSSHHPTLVIEAKL